MGRAVFKLEYIQETRGSQSDVNEDSSLLEHDAVLMGE
jgi:hypothetical protein